MSASTTQPDLIHDASGQGRPHATRGPIPSAIGAGLLTALLLVGCHKQPAGGVHHAGDSAHAGASGEQAHAGTSGHGAHWSYDGATGPAAWAELDPAFATCSAGTHQSPIDLPASVPAASDHHIEFHYQAVPLKVVNNGLPADHHFYHYTGSLTTPPCSEDVAWNVMAYPIAISAEHVQAFHALYPVNARPVQPLHDRAISGGV